MNSNICIKNFFGTHVIKSNKNIFREWFWEWTLLSSFSMFSGPYTDWFYHPCLYTSYLLFPNHLKCPTFIKLSLNTPNLLLNCCSALYHSYDIYHLIFCSMKVLSISYLRPYVCGHYYIEKGLTISQINFLKKRMKKQISHFTSLCLSFLTLTTLFQMVVVKMS